MGIYRDNLSAITFYRLSLKIVWIYRLPLSPLLYILSPINCRDKQFFMHAVHCSLFLKNLEKTFLQFDLQKKRRLTHRKFTATFIGKIHRYRFSTERFIVPITAYNLSQNLEKGNPDK